jgi:hypothetical protein
MINWHEIFTEKLLMNEENVERVELIVNKVKHLTGYELDAFCIRIQYIAWWFPYLSLEAKCDLSLQYTFCHLS